MNEISKRVLEIIIEKMEDELDVAERAREDSVKDAIEAEGAMQSRYSTWKEESQYLAGGQAKRIEEIMGSIRNACTILKHNPSTSKQAGVPSLVTVKDRDKQVCYILVPVGCGGHVIEDIETGLQINAVNFQSPIGQTLFGKKEGDLIESTMFEDDCTVIKIL